MNWDSGTKELDISQLRKEIIEKISILSNIHPRFIYIYDLIVIDPNTIFFHMIGSSDDQGDYTYDPYAGTIKKVELPESGK